MGIWSDLATWVGPTPNRGGAMIEWRGTVIHIAEGTYEGTISWQKNDASNVSSHFIVAKDGRIAQMVDTDQTAWTQGAGNGHWLSVENEGFSGTPLTPQQIEANAQLYARGVKAYGYPVQLTETPSGRGYGWHGMGGVAWGNHPNCPGVPIRNQRAEILARVNQILGGGGNDVAPPALSVTLDGDVAHFVWDTPKDSNPNEAIFRINKDVPFPQWPTTVDGNMGKDFHGPWGTAIDIDGIEEGHTYYAQVYARATTPTPAWTPPGSATLYVGTSGGEPPPPDDISERLDAIDAKVTRLMDGVRANAAAVGE